MKKVILLSSILIIPLLLGAGCQSGDSVTGQAGHLNLDNQVACATQAEETLKNFEKQHASDAINGNGYSVPSLANYDQTNHYNQKLNKCFVLIKFNYTPEGMGDKRVYTMGYLLDTGEVLYDAFENIQLAGCLHNPNTTDVSKSDLCDIPNGGMITYDKYQSIVNEKMELQ